jgi:hypothetical protein
MTSETITITITENSDEVFVNLSDALKIVPVPVTNVSNGEIGYVAFDSTYLYVCIAQNTWKRISFDVWE